MKLLTKNLLKKLPLINATEDLPIEKQKVIIKFFHPFAQATWYATGYDPENRMFFGFANLGDDEMAELGYFSLDELMELKVRGLGVERDLWWDQETTLDKVVSFSKKVVHLNYFAKGKVAALSFVSYKTTKLN